MSYLVLARKYRPQRFSELIGQEHVARTLSNAIAANRVHHAFLFTGARGVGKTSAARILAKALSCEKGPTAEPCGVCDICQEIAGGRSVDVIEIDAASNTKVEETKSVLEGVRYLPARARRKVYIIDEVHMLSAHSWNALLKTLEEPPPHVVFVFATTEVHKIPATILSRCQRFDFKLISTARLTTHSTEILQAEKIDATPEAVRLVARQAAGSVRDGLSLLDQTIAYVGSEKLTAEVTADVLGIADRQLLVGLATAALDRDPGNALRLIARAADRGVDLGQLGRSFLGFLRDLEVIASVKPAPGVELADLIDATPEEIDEARALAERARRRAWSRSCSTAGRARSTRRRSCRRRGCSTRWRRSICARRSRWCRSATCCSGSTISRGACAARARPPSPARAAAGGTGARRVGAEGEAGASRAARLGRPGRARRARVRRPVRLRRSACGANAVTPAAPAPQEARRPRRRPARTRPGGASWRPSRRRACRWARCSPTPTWCR